MADDRFNGAVVWAGLTQEQRDAIGGVALELLAAWWTQEQSCDPYDGDDPLLRAADRADVLLIGMLQERMVDAVPRDLLEFEGRPRLPSLLGPVCRVCGCSQDDACFPSCDWAEPDLCTGCVKEAAHA